MPKKKRNPYPSNGVLTVGGIDPGASGGFALIQGQSVLHRPIPETPLEIKDVLCEFFAEADFVFLEKVHSSRQMGVASAFTFGKGYGALEIGLAFLEVPYSLVTPQAWQSGLGIPKADPDQPQSVHKEKLRATAQRIFPKLAIWKQPKSLGLQRSVCDALLIAHYCRLMYRHQ